jgi:membrane protease subunit (stomatin/prohibitin family)
LFDLSKYMQEDLVHRWTQHCKISVHSPNYVA